MNRRAALIVDLDRHATEALRRRLEVAGWEVRAAYDADEVMRADPVSFSAIFVDPGFVSIDGAPPLDYVRLKAPGSTPVVLLHRPDADAEERYARMGFPHTAAKPYDEGDIARLLIRLETAAGTDAPDFGELVGSSPPMLRLYDAVRAVADTAAAALITGETGSGKELVAQSIHNLSRRRFRRFVTIDCAALSEDLLETELFGHEKGAFTGAIRSRAGKFEYADGGTVFLDEIGEVSPRVQQRLLKVIETGRVTRIGANEPVAVDIRFLFATHRDLAAMVREGSFRADLFYRINTYPIAVPPLRERPEDIPKLVRRFVRQAALRHDRPVTGVDPSAMNRLIARSWEGNVRELIKAVERATLVAGGGVLTIADFSPTDIASAPAAEDDFVGMTYKGMTTAALAPAERRYFARLLSDCGGNMTKAARSAGLDRKTLYARLAAVGLDPASFREPKGG
jgi:two-component system response regulator HydG